MRTLKAVQEIPHKDDKEIGFKALRKYINEYSYIYNKELNYLGEDPDDFRQEVFFNMIRRNGYPQYNAKKNRGSFRSYVFCNCKRYQIDLARKRDTKIKQLSRLTGGVPRHYMLSLNMEVMNKKQDSSTELIDILYGGSLDTSRLEIEYLLNRLPKGIVSLEIPITKKKLGEFFIEGYTEKEIAKFFSVDWKLVKELREEIGKTLWGYYNEV